MKLVLALDIGGTFTDLVAFDLESGAIHQTKSSTTPYDLAVGIRETLTKSGLPIDRADMFIHGSTVAINTAIERTGARTALITTQGMRDVYKIGRGNRPESYNLFFKRPVPYVPRHLTFEMTERLDARGGVVTAFDPAVAAELVRTVNAEDVEAVAVCFLHSWANPEHEAALGAVLDRDMPDSYRSLSHEILREYREYERTSTTVLNAYVGPRVRAYLGDLEELLRGMGFAGKLLIMQSNGGTMSPERAKRVPVATMESGPVGGIIAAAEVCRDLGYPDVLAFDMGGTTAKVSLVQRSEPSIAQGYYIGGEASGHPVMLPVVDIIEVGALRVGPRSAGGYPGPVCYGNGNTQPTVSDANVVLGRMVATNFLGGEMQLDVAAAREAIRVTVADPLGLTVEEAALGIVQIAVAEMSLAVRGVSVQRGYDPRDFALVAFGGAGPLHSAQVARELHVPTMIVPRVPGHFSALGMLMADLRHDFVRTYYRPLASSDFGEIRTMFDAMIAEGERLLAADGVMEDQMSAQRFLDIRYVGQEFPIQTPVDERDVANGDVARIRAAFDAIHDRRFGHHAPQEAVEIVNVRLTATGKREQLRFPNPTVTEQNAVVGEASVVFDDPRRPVDAPIYDRAKLAAGARVDGPAVIVEYASTTLLFAGDRMQVAPSGEMIVRIGDA